MPIPAFRPLFALLTVGAVGVADATAGPAAASPQALPQAHAHNDYAHSRPLLDALDHGFQSVEADVHLVDGELLVAHDRADCVPGRTLRALYLEPLAARVAANRGRVHRDGPLEFQLLIDFKTGGEATYRALATELEAFRGMLSRFDTVPRRRGAVLAVLSGAAPDAVVRADPERLCALDGWFVDGAAPGTPDEYPLLSRSWRGEFTWLGDGPMPDAERARLDAAVRAAHDAGRRLRYWAVPNLARVWALQLEAGVDWLNVDNLPGARRFLTGAGAELWARAALDRFVDAGRIAGRDNDAPAAARLAARLAADGHDCASVAALLAKGRARYAAPELPVGQIVAGLPLACEHVDHTTSFLLYLPQGFDPERVTSLLLIGHGGNGAMDRAYAERAATAGLAPWRPIADQRGWILAAPSTERGWGAIGNSIVLSLVAKLRRWYRLDPDRIHLTGHSMGGHLTWRTALNLGDRFASVAPMSGGYDYVANGEVARLWTVPGYATFGVREPYGIADHNRRIGAWLAAQGYPWQVVEKPGGHEIFADELPKVAAFFAAHPRDRHPERVFTRAGANPAFDRADANDRWGRTHTWDPARAIAHSTAHWLRLGARADLPAGSLQTAAGRIERATNRIELVTDGVRSAELALTPEEVDFARPLEVIANGECVFRDRVEPDLAALLRTVREFDDPLRAPHAIVPIAIASDRPVPTPRGSTAR